MHSYIGDERITVGEIFVSYRERYLRAAYQQIALRVESDGGPYALAPVQKLFFANNALVGHFDSEYIECLPWREPSLADNSLNPLENTTM